MKTFFSCLIVLSTLFTLTSCADDNSGFVAIGDEDDGNGPFQDEENQGVPPVNKPVVNKPINNAPVNNGPLTLIHACNFPNFNYCEELYSNTNAKNDCVIDSTNVGLCPKDANYLGTCVTNLNAAANIKGQTKLFYYVSGNYPNTADEVKELCNNSNATFEF